MTFFHASVRSLRSKVAAYARRARRPSGGRPGTPLRLVPGEPVRGVLTPLRRRRREVLIRDDRGHLWLRDDRGRRWRATEVLVRDASGHPWRVTVGSARYRELATVGGREEAALVYDRRRRGEPRGGTVDLETGRIERF